MSWCSTGAQNAAMVTVEEVKQLPPLQEREQSGGSRGGGRFGNRRFSGGGGGRGGGGRGFGGGRGRGGGGGNRFNKRY